MNSIQRFFKRQYDKVFTSKRLSFADRFFLVFPRLPLNVANLLVQVVMFKYFTDVVGLNPLHVGTIFLILSIWNAVNDPLIGILLDRMPYIENKGKYLFIAKLTVPIIGVTSLGLLLVQGGWENWLVYTYLLTMFVFYEAGITAYYTGINSYLFLRLRNTEERVEYSVLATYFTYILSAVVTMIPLIMFVGDKPVSYITPVMIIIITANTVLFWVSLLKLKETPESYKEDFTNQDAQLAKDIVQYTKDIVKSRGFWVVNTLSYLFHLSVAYYFTFYLYYMDNIIGATSTQSVLIDLSNGLILFLFIPFIPAIYRRFGIRNAYALLMIPGIIGFMGLYFVNNVFTTFLVFALIVITHGAQMTISGPATSLVIDEDWQRTGKRKVGYISALNALVVKPATGIRSFVFGAVLAYYGYNGTAEVQTERAIEGLRLASSIIPLMALVLAFFVVMLLPYSKKRENEIIAKRREMEESGALGEDKDVEDIYDFG